MFETLRIAKLVTFGVGGDGVELGKGSHISGYGNPDRPHASAPSDTLMIPDGCPAIDMRPAVESGDGVKLAISGPMVNVDLADDDVDRCPEPSALMGVAMAGNAYGTMLAVQKVSRLADPVKPGPLDKVSVKVYIGLWRDAGARIGHYMGGSIVWDA